MPGFLTVIPPLVVGAALLKRTTNATWLIAALAGLPLGLALSAAGLWSWRLAMGSVGPIYFVVEAIVATCFFWWCSREPPATDPMSRNASGPAPGVYRASLMLVAATAAIAWTTIIANHPYGNWDAWAFWNVRAIMLDGHADWTDAFTIASWPHRDYPLLVPNLLLRLGVAGADLRVTGPAFLDLIFVIGTLVLLYRLLAERAGTTAALLGTAVLLATPFFVEQAADHFADIKLGYFMLLAIGALTRRPTSRLIHAAMCGLATGLALWTKNEGQAFALVISIAVLAVIWRGRWDIRQAFFAMMAAAPFGALLVSQNIALGLSGDLLSPDAVAQWSDHLFSLQRHAIVLLGWLKHGLLFSNGLPLFVIGFLIWQRRFADRQKTESIERALPALVIVSMILIYHLVFVTTPRDLQWHINTAMERLVLQVWPMALLLVFSRTVAVKTERPL